jgi:hypothetical protein
MSEGFRTITQLKKEIDTDIEELRSFPLRDIENFTESMLD